jgi:hypothetical protein
MRGRSWSRCTLPLAMLLSIAGALATAPLAAGQAASQIPSHASQIPTVAGDNAAGYRLWVLVFDISSMQADDVARAKAVATTWIDTGMNEDDLVSVVTIGSSLKLLENFTVNWPRVRLAVSGIKTEAESSATPVDPALQERDLFNNDLRLRGLRTLCSGLAAIPQTKAIMYFTAARERPGDDNKIELLAATNTCSQARVTINTLDMHAGRGGGSR